MPGRSFFSDLLLIWGSMATGHLSQMHERNNIFSQKILFDVTVTLKVMYGFIIVKNARNIGERNFVPGM